MSKLTEAQRAYGYAFKAQVFAVTKQQLVTAEMLMKNALHKLREALAEETELYAAPVDAMKVYKEAYEAGRLDMKQEAAKFVEEHGPRHLMSEDVAAGIRGLK